MIIAGITVSGGCEENDILYGSDNFCNLITYFKVLKLPFGPIVLFAFGKK